MMLAYAANRRAAAKQESSPHTLLLVISVHVAVIAMVMSARMDLPGRLQHGPPLVRFRLETPPPPEKRSPAQHRRVEEASVRTHVPDHKVEAPSVAPDVAPTASDTGYEMTGAGGDHLGSSQPPQPPATEPVRHDPRLMTPASELKPPYPPAKLASEEEATLRLRLVIDEKGHVIAVEPVGHADPAFLESARRYMLLHWRFDPATEDGRAVSSTIVITLRFALDG